MEVRDKMKGMIHDQFQKASLIRPSFPNWEKSFVSGPESTLFILEHRIQNDPVLLITRARFQPHAEGPPGHVHGGATAGLIDEVLGILAWNQNYACVTQTLNLRYRKALPLSLEAYVVTRIESILESMIELKCVIQDSSGKEYVEATGHFHRLTPEQLQRFSKKMK